MHFNKVVIWGYPLHTHTHSYIHASWVKVFKHLGYETHWFHDDNFPKDFDFRNTMFITEGYADKHVPVNDSSIYFVHIAIDPTKYLSKGARLIDIRFNVDYINDLNYSYSVNRNELQKIDECAYFLANADDSVLADSFRRGISGYEALYLSWATDLLPHEINLDSRYHPRERSFYFIGTIGENNASQLGRLNEFLTGVSIPFYHVDPWSRPLSFEDTMALTKKSYIAPDIRGCLIRKNVNGKPDTGVDHKNTGYIPCRVFKNISYGQLGATNSLAVKKLFGDLIVYSHDERELGEMCERHSKDYDFIEKQMQHVRDSHTFINRANSLLQIASYK